MTACAPPWRFLSSGSLPPALARLSNLGVLRLSNNRLSGDLKAFADAVPDPAGAAAAALAIAQPEDNATIVQMAAGAAAAAAGSSSLFELNLTSNSFTGPVPEGLARLGVFDPDLTVLVAGAGGEPTLGARTLDLSDNTLSGPWPTWLLDAVCAYTCAPGTIHALPRGVQHAH
jgi:hypothetical protein